MPRYLYQGYQESHLKYTAPDRNKHWGYVVAAVLFGVGGAVYKYAPMQQVQASDTAAKALLAQVGENCIPINPNQYRTVLVPGNVVTTPQGVPLAENSVVCSGTGEIALIGPGGVVGEVFVSGEVRDKFPQILKNYIGGQ